MPVFVADGIVGRVNRLVLLHLRGALGSLWGDRFDLPERRHLGKRPLERSRKLGRKALGADVCLEQRLVLSTQRGQMLLESLLMRLELLQSLGFGSQART